MKSKIHSSLAVVLLGAAATLQGQITSDLTLDIEAHPPGVSMLATPNSPLLYLTSNSQGSDLAKVMVLDPSQAPAQATELVRWSGQVNEISRDPATGILYAVGDVATANLSRAWQIYSSVDGGVTWNVAAPNYQLTSGVDAKAIGAVSDNSGNLFVSGWARKTGGTYIPKDQHMIIRKRNAQGVWTTSLAISTRSGIDSGAGIHFVAPQSAANPGGIFAVGRVNYAWTVQRSRDAGVTWTAVDSFLVNKGGAATAISITSDSGGTLYVGGQADDKNGQGWYVRKSSDGGATWKTIIINSPGGDNWLTRLAYDSVNNNLWAVGIYAAASANSRWAMIRYNPATGSSATSVPYPNNQSSALGLAATDLGNVFVTGGYSAERGHLAVLQTH